MAGYKDTRQLIIDTLMNRPAGTEIQPENHQEFALAITDYVRSVELLAGNAFIGFAEANTAPVQSDKGQCFYISTVGPGQTVDFVNFIDSNGNAISVSSPGGKMSLVTLIWNTQYWSSQIVTIDTNWSIAQQSGSSESMVMSQKATTDAIAAEETRAKEAEENIGDELNAVENQYGFYPYTEHNGYLLANGDFSNDAAYHNKTTKCILCQPGDVFSYYGKGYASAISWIFRNGSTIVSTGQFDGITNVVIPSGVDNVQFSSCELVTKDIYFNVYKISPETIVGLSESLKEQIFGIPYLFRAGYYLSTAGQLTQITGSSCKYTDTIPCIEGQKFVYTGKSEYSVAGWIFRNGSTIVSTGQFNGTTVVTITSGVDNVQFSSYGTGLTPDAITFAVYDINSIIGKLYILQNDMGVIKPQVEENTRSINGVIMRPLPFEEMNRYLNTTGALSAINPAIFGKITEKLPCVPGEIYRYTGRSDASVAGWVLYNDNMVVSYGQYLGANPEYSGTQYVIIPNGVNYIRFCSYGQNTTFDAVPFEVVKIDSNNINQIIESIENDLYGFKTKTVNGRYMTATGSYASNPNGQCKITIRIPCNTGDQFVYTGRGEYSAISWIFRNGSTIVSTGQFNGTTVVTIPSGVDNVQFSSYSPDGTAILNVYKKGAIGEKVDALYKGLNGNVLYGKKWVACGDSFTQGDFSGLTDQTLYKFQDEPYRGQNKVYPFFIGRRNNMQIVNAGISGSIMALSKEYIDDPTNVDIGYRSPFAYQRYKNIPIDADYITLWFGINDASHTYLGTINDTTNETFYGAWNVVLEYLITNHPLAKIGIIVTDGTSATTYKQAVREVAQKWGIPYLDMTGDYQTPPIFERENSLNYSSVAKSLRTAQFRVTATNGHPNAAAHEYQSTFIENFLRRL